MSGPSRPGVAADFVIPALALGLTGYYLVSTADLLWEARSTGLLVGLGLVVLCAAQMARLGVQLMGRQATPGFGGLLADTRDNRRRLALLALLSGFALTVSYTGIVAGLFICLAGGLAVMGVRSLKQLVLIPGITVLIVFLLFIVVLDSRLPRGPVESLLLGLIGGGG